ncbi:Clavaminate synthase-like protein [Immersiella caudata]|uniref:Clavaminate synthase-like protein n=1 Tax=Immersiella caudata TaxID=314043 RepID=A0AA40BXB2_9PEZI|nr:Clavaminate synthase-like protein [Immersiella caudata]
MLAALQFNEGRPPAARLRQLYIAQASLNRLPGILRRDFRTPDLVRNAGNGDIYNSSVWFGLQPTYTPWHRDPNPNLFHQIWDTKEVRLLPLGSGNNLFYRTKAMLGSPGGSARIRGPEMMEGEERKALHDAVWGPDSPKTILKASLGPGDTLFIPKGWWHSLRSTGFIGSPNVSVNWWFR